MRVWARILPETTDDIVLITSNNLQPNLLMPLHFIDNYDSVPVHNGHRQKREAYDPYEAYYFYPKSLNQRPYYDSQSAENSYINRRDAEESNRIGPNGQKYKYTPLFQYKSTQSRRRKLFVPNLFG